MASLVLAVLGVLASAAGAIGAQRAQPHAPDPVTERGRRSDRLTESLRESADLLSELESDIQRGQDQVSELQSQVERDKELAKLTEEEAVAMRSVLANVIGRSDRRGFWQQFGLNLLFFAFGVGVTLLMR